MSQQSFPGTTPNIHTKINQAPYLGTETPYQRCIIRKAKLSDQKRKEAWVSILNFISIQFDLTWPLTLLIERLCFLSSKALVWGSKTYIDISFGEVILSVVFHLKTLIITDQRIPVMAKVELFVCATCMCVCVCVCVCVCACVHACLW